MGSGTTSPMMSDRAAENLARVVDVATGVAVDAGPGMTTGVLRRAYPFRTQSASVPGSLLPSKSAAPQLPGDTRARDAVVARGLVVEDVGRQHRRIGGRLGLRCGVSTHRERSQAAVLPGLPALGPPRPPLGTAVSTPKTPPKTVSQVAVGWYRDVEVRVASAFVPQETVTVPSAQGWTGPWQPRKRRSLSAASRAAVRRPFGETQVHAVVQVGNCSPTAWAPASAAASDAADSSRFEA